MAGTKAAKGKRMTTTGRWTLTPKRGTKRVFTGALRKTLNIGKVRIAIFTVPKGFK
jgi:hypothetical protein